MVPNNYWSLVEMRLFVNNYIHSNLIQVSIIINLEFVFKEYVQSLFLWGCGFFFLIKASPYQSRAPKTTNHALRERPEFPFQKKRTMPEEAAKSWSTFQDR